MIANLLLASITSIQLISNKNFHVYIKLYLVYIFIALQKKVISVISTFIFFLAQHIFACGVF